MKVRALYTFYQPTLGAGRHATRGEMLAAMPLRQAGEEFDVTPHEADQLRHMKAVEQVHT